MKRAVWTALLLLGGVLAWQGVRALQDVPEVSTPPQTPEADAQERPPADTPPAVARPIPGNRVETPMRDRVATLGVLNKRNGLSRDLTLKPGQAVRMGDLVVRLRACEETAPWEPEKWTGAFVQVITGQSGTRWRKTFSGWLYKESPSLNVVEHPIYDVWVKACRMRHADVGPDTILARGDGSATASKAARSGSSSDVGAVPDKAAESSAE